MFAGLIVSEECLYVSQFEFGDIDVAEVHDFITSKIYPTFSTTNITLNGLPFVTFWYSNTVISTLIVGSTLK